MSGRGPVRSADRGSVLPMVLVLTVVGSVMVLALLNFAVTLFRTQPAVAERDDTFQTARSGMELAIVLQRDAGPSGCFTDTRPPSFALNGSAVDVSCTFAGAYYGSARNQLGVVTTSVDPSSALSGPGVARLRGEIFIDGGAADAGRDWFDLVGEDPELDGSHTYPMLPPVPAYVRGTAKPPKIGNCDLYFPGRYIEPLTLKGGEHYFASGVYYFEEPLTMTDDARVVAGQGSIEGCAGGDAPAAGNKKAPSDPTITGRGVTFLFGGNGRLVVNGANLSMNRRVSDATTRGTDGISIRTVNFGSSPAAPQPATVIPPDQVLLGSVYSDQNSSCNAALSTAQCVQAVADHEVRLDPGEPGGRYTTSALTPLDAAVLVDQGAASSGANGVVIDGMVLTPNSNVVVVDDLNPAHELRMASGVVANSLQLGDQSPSADYVIGMIDQAIQRRFALVVQVTSPEGGRARSEAVLDVNVNGHYAINAWSVDASK